MFKGILGALLFVFFLIVFFVFLAWGYIVRTIRRYHRANKVKADREEIHYRMETGRIRQQYGQRQQPNNNGQRPTGDSQQATANNQQETADNQQARRTQTATGETIIDHRHQERSDKKIFEDSDGEYVEFTEE